MNRQWLAEGPLRPLALRVLQKFNPGDIHIWHPYFPRKVRLHSFRHKGYWFYRSDRERETSEFYIRAIAPTDLVVEVGAHIGFQTLHFAALVAQGEVVAFEPGSNNLPYCLHNCAGVANVEVRRMAVGKSTGTATFYEDNVTGQNNSLTEIGREFALDTAKSSHFAGITLTPTTVQVTTLDHEFADRFVQFIKVDVEGGEADVIAGGLELIDRSHPTMMIEVAADNRDYLWQVLVDDRGYEVRKPNGTSISSADDMNDNTTFTHPDGPMR